MDDPGPGPIQEQLKITVMLQGYRNKTQAVLLRKEG
jgi:hypothetical protein